MLVRRAPRSCYAVQGADEGRSGIYCKRCGFYCGFSSGTSPGFAPAGAASGMALFPSGRAVLRPPTGGSPRRGFRKPEPRAGAPLGSGDCFLLQGRAAEVLPGRPERSSLPGAARAGLEDRRPGRSPPGGPRAAFVYGSFASGKEKAGSDVDLLVVGDVSLGELVEALGPVQSRLGREVNPAVFPPSEFREKMTPFLENVLQGPKIFLIGSPDELERLAPVRVARRA